MPKLVRVAICQLTCHPALYAAQQMYLEEPFLIDNSNISLSYLSLKGFAVGGLLDYCRDEYIYWHKERLRQIFKYISEISTVPNLLFFPEYSIPYQCLDVVKQFHDSTSTSVFAGTHSLQNLKESRKIYQTLGLGKKSIDRHLKRTKQSYCVAPIFINGKVYLIDKKILSPFERTDVTSFDLPQNKPIDPLTISYNEKTITVLLLICAEALNYPDLKIRSDFNVAAIISYDRKPSQFEPIVNLLKSNKKAVIYCNDGLYGCSEIAIPVDTRSQNWWFSSNLSGKMPKGDSLIIADIDLDNLSVQVGTALPQSNFSLIKLCSIVYRKDLNSCNISLKMNDIRSWPDNEFKGNSIQDLIRTNKCDSLQFEKYSHLSKMILKGQCEEEWWDMIGEDIILDIPSLSQLEGRLSKKCFKTLSEALVEYETNKEGFESLRQFLKKTKLCSKSFADEEIDTDKAELHGDSILNRDEDAKQIISFFDDRRLKIAQITGFEQIGKTATIEKALEHCMLRKIIQVQIHETSSAEYLLQKLFSNSVFEGKILKDFSVWKIKEEDITELLNTIDMLWFHNSEHLLSRYNWKNEETKFVIDKLITGSINSKCKIVFESRINLPLELYNPTIILRKRIYGLERKLQIHGVEFLNYQLRRVGLSPTEISIEDKEFIVTKLGGHPYALAISADAIFDEGLNAVLEALKRKAGFYLGFVNGILKRISICDDEKLILKLLSGCRIPLPREVILQTFDYAVNPYLKNLISLCLVEIDSSSFIRIPGLIEAFFDFNEVAPDLRAKFHAACGENFKKVYESDKRKVEYAIEADIHSSLSGNPTNLSGTLIDSQFELAKKHYQDQNFKNAKNILDKIPDNKKPSDILRLSALADAKCNQFSTAIAKSKKVFSENPRDTYLLSQIAGIALSQGRDDVAEKLIDTAKAANMEDTSILIVSGRMLLRRNDLPNAEKVFIKAIQITRRTPWPFFFLGKIYIRYGEFDKAIDALFDGEKFIYENNIRNQRALSAIRTQLGIAYLLNDDVDMAEKTISGLYDESDKDPEVIRAYALITIKKEGIDKAFEAFKKLSEGRIRSQSDRSQFHLYYGLFYLGLGDKGNASLEFGKAHKADKNNVYVMMKLAKTYYDMAIESHIDGEVDIAKSYANDCGIIVKKILEFDSDNQTGIDLQYDLHRKFDVELSKIDT